MHTSRRWWMRRVHGLETLELLLVLPLFVSILMLALNGGYAMFAHQLVQEAVRNGCRVGVVANNPSEAAVPEINGYLDLLTPSERSVSVGIGNGFLQCEAAYRVPSTFPLFPEVWVHGLARFRMEGWR